MSGRQGKVACCLSAMGMLGSVAKLCDPSYLNSQELYVSGSFMVLSYINHWILFLWTIWFASRPSHARAKATSGTSCVNLDFGHNHL